ncbi:MAG: 1-(5-phosphoribosyl)-5-[(5-phosphoribosylamino)methylideneamino]imidazole-4-carboxamide isomerase [Ignavibacterium sp.]|uniref:1-(5-phosphoribosyl)-5-[(5- phosphoribosylamino)methylideneamino]imidazole-4- carboxamide isomerase n=1 Tax=Ignavibacterium sp. TaxID=2651167 RepID=UPI004049B215
MHPLKKYLLVIPSIDIKDGKTVRVVQGIPELNCKEYGNDPVEMAMIWRAENAKMLHVVDFDGALEHSHKNYSIIEKICSSVIIPVEFAGGVRTIEDADELFDMGISRIAINTMALENRALFNKLFEKHGPNKVVISLDIIDDELVTRGRQYKTGINYLSFAKEMAELGIERFIVTDIKRNGVLGGPNISYSLNVAELTKAKVTHSGGVRNKDELIDLQNYLEKGIDSVIVGRALYENRFPCQKIWRIAESGIFS